MTLLSRQLICVRKNDKQKLEERENMFLDLRKKNHGREKVCRWWAISQMRDFAKYEFD